MAKKYQRPNARSETWIEAWQRVSGPKDNRCPRCRGRLVVFDRFPICPHCGYENYNEG